VRYKLYGTQSVGEDGRLCPGGEANETEHLLTEFGFAQPTTTMVMCLHEVVFSILFSGIAFSTGGYSAEYGEALSSFAFKY
jgi:hypothetical protein